MFNRYWKFPFFFCDVWTFFQSFFYMYFVESITSQTEIQINVSGCSDSWLPVSHWEPKYQYLSYQPDNYDNISTQTKHFHQLTTSDSRFLVSASEFENSIFTHEICGVNNNNNNNNETDVKSILPNLLPNPIEQNDRVLTIWFEILFYLHAHQKSHIRLNAKKKERSAILVWFLFRRFFSIIIIPSFMVNRFIVCFGFVAALMATIVTRSVPF